MKWYQKLNPFFLRACLESAERDKNYLRSSLAESNRKLELRTEEYEEALRQLTVCRNNQPRYAELKGRNECLTNANSHLNEALQEKTIEVKQLRADLKVCEAELKRSKAINTKWFEIALGYGIDDFTLLNKSLWGSKIGIVELPSGEKDE